MLPKNTRHILYAVLLLALFVVGTSAIANSKVYSFISVVADVNFADAAELTEEGNIGAKKAAYTETDLAGDSNIHSVASPPMFMTIIQGADEEVVCPNDGSTVAKFFLCGTSDIRTLSLSQSGSTYQWQKLDEGRCATSVIED